MVSVTLFKQVESSTLILSLVRSKKSLLIIFLLESVWQVIHNYRVAGRNYLNYCKPNKLLQCITDIVEALSQQPNTYSASIIMNSYNCGKAWPELSNKYRINQDFEVGSMV